MALIGGKPQYNMAGGLIGKPKQGFDYQSLLSNPLLHAGIGLLGSTGREGPQAALQGALQGVQLRQQFDQQAQEKAKQERLQQLSGQLPGLYESGGIEGFVPALLGNEATMGAGLSLIGKTMPAATADPSNVREWQYFSGLAPDQQKQYLAMKRASQLYKMGDVTMQHDPLGAAPTVAGVPAATQADAQAALSAQAAEKAAGVKAAEQAIAQSGKAFEQLRPVGESIALLDQVSAELDAGAETGPIMSKLPSVSSASVALDNLQAQLGLNVIQNTTFGALSEAELNMALSTALPTGLKPAELRNWVQRKRDAQVKLKNYLEEAATYLGTPGNTVASFIEMKSGGGDSDIQSLVDKYTK